METTYATGSTRFLGLMENVAFEPLLYTCLRAGFCRKKTIRSARVHLQCDEVSLQATTTNTSLAL